MPKKTKKKAAKKRSKKAAAKKAAVKKTAVKKTAKKKPISRNTKKNSTGTSTRVASPKTVGGCEEPDICTGSFTAENNDCVEFQNIPQNTTVTLYQVSSTSYYPFTPYETDSDGLRYSEIQAGDELTIVVPTLNKTYYYKVEGDANCPNDAPGHSVTVNS